MAILKAGTYVFKAVPALASSLVQSEFTYKTYDLTNNDIYTTEPRTYLFMGSNMQSSDTKNIAIVKMTNSPGATEWSEKTYEAARGWYRFYYNGDFDSVTDRYTATDTTKFRTIIVESDQTVDDAFYTWFMTNIEKPQVNIDLTTLSGYESLSAGTYALSVKAKAQGYQDSDLSSTVSFTKLAAPVVTASGTTVTWNAITNAESYDVYVDGELYENTTGGVTYNIITTVTNGTYSGDTTITDTATITITADSGYNLPDTVTVTGASKTWNKETGTLTLTNPTGNVTVTVVCVASTPTEIWILKNQKPSSPSGNYLNLPINTAVYAKSGTVYKWINYDEAREIYGGIDAWAIRYMDSCLYIGGYDTYGNPAIPVYEGKYHNEWIFGYWDDGVTKSTTPTDTTNLRTIKFYSVPTGNLLTWLQSNGTKQ